jgi:hypothetical protein
LTLPKCLEVEWEKDKFLSCITDGISPQMEEGMSSADGMVALVHLCLTSGWVPPHGLLGPFLYVQKWKSLVPLPLEPVVQFLWLLEQPE